MTKPATRPRYETVLWRQFPRRADLLAGQSPSEPEIFRETRENWHEQKLSIALVEWQQGLKWLRDNGLIPRGTGRPTKPISKPAAKRTETPAEPVMPALLTQPSATEPLMAANGEALRVRIYSSAGELVLKSGTAVARNQTGGVTTWSVLPDGESTPRQYQSPPAVLKRLKKRGE